MTEAAKTYFLESLLCFREVAFLFFCCSYRSMLATTGLSSSLSFFQQEPSEDREAQVRRAIVHLESWVSRDSFTDLSMLLTTPRVYGMYILVSV